MNRSITAPMPRRRVLIFDVETTGLIPRGAVNIAKCPHILSLSFVIYDLFSKQIVRKYDSYVKVDDSVEISEFVINLTGITREICQTKGNSIIDVLKQFYEAYMLCEVLVAHNMEFDEKMILIEIERNRIAILADAPYCLMIFNETYEKMNNILRYCTMKNGTSLCNIMFEPKPGETTQVSGRPKYPKLSELHAKLFDGKVPDGLHNSMIDVFACLRCYLHMQHGFDCGVMVV